MTIPTSNQFSEWLVAAGADVFDAALLDAGVGEGFLTRDQACRLLVAFRTRRYEAWKSAWKLPAMQWLQSQLEFVRASNKIHLGRRPKTLRIASTSATAYDQWAEKYISHVELDLQRRAQRVNGLQAGDAELTTTRLKIRLRQHLRTGWTEHCVKALQEYFSGVAAEQVITARKQLPITAAKAQKALREYFEQADVILSHDFSLGRLSTWHRLNRLREFAVNLPLCEEQPLRRTDTRQNERLFVYRMWRANMQAVRGPRTEVIADLMSMDGFLHQYDSRTIEKQCKEFTGMYRQSSSGLLPG